MKNIVRKRVDLRADDEALPLLLGEDRGDYGPDLLDVVVLFHASPIG